MSERTGLAAANPLTVTNDGTWRGPTWKTITLKPDESRPECVVRLALVHPRELGFCPRIVSYAKVSFKRICAKARSAGLCTCVDDRVEEELTRQPERIFVTTGIVHDALGNPRIVRSVEGWNGSRLDKMILAYRCVPASVWRLDQPMIFAVR